MNKIKICLAQMEVIPANPRANTDKILECISKAKKDGAEIIVFPELSLPGYILGDIWERESFLNECMDCLEEVREASEGIIVVIGSIDIDRTKKNEDGRVRKYNTCFVFKNKILITTAIKTLQPNYREFDDNRHFYDNRKVFFDNNFHSIYTNSDGTLLSKNVILLDARPQEQLPFYLSFVICEDSWSNDYSISPINEIDKYFSPKMIINISCSPFTSGKNNKRNRVFGNHANNINAPIVYVNNTGVQNNGKTVYTFDGNSCIYDKSGNQINPYKSFEEGCETFEIDLDEDFGDKGYFPKDDISVVHDSIVYGTKKFMEQMGINKVVIGASGGIDSAVVSALMSEILPPENMLLINMPSKFNSQTTKDLAQELARNIGCRYIVHPVGHSCEATAREIRMRNTLDNIPKDNCSVTDFVFENIQARDRSSRVLAAWAAWFGGCFTCNANKSESAVGYTTLYGDLDGFVCPIADLWKTQVYELANYINSNVNKIIPQGSIDIIPSAELSEKQNVDKNMGDPIIYSFHDRLFSSWIERWNRATLEDNLKWYLNGTLEKEIGYNGNIKELFPTDKSFIEDLERWWKCYTMSVFKRVQAPTSICISCRPVSGYDIRESQLPLVYTKNYLKMKKELLGDVS